MDPYNVSDCRLALNRNTPIPLWSQIEDYLASAISERRLLPGQSLGSELELAERFRVSRPTIRHALNNLSQVGLITRRRAVGTFVAT